MEILTGPKGGKYYIDEKGKKHYIKKDIKSDKPSENKFSSTKSKSSIKLHNKEDSEIRYKKHTVTVSDYEHSGDIDHEIAYIKSICPQARNFKGWEEEDYEAESDYEQDYGECDEPIYQGYVSFEAPADYDEKLKEYDLY